MRFFILLTISLFLLTGCFYNDPLFLIRRLSRNEDLAKKQEASAYYKQAIDTLVDAYSAYSGLNREIGLKLLMNQEYKAAIKHLEITTSIKNNDSSAYYWLGIAYMNLYKIENNKEQLEMAEKNYKIALNITPTNKEYLYGYAQLLFYGYSDYDQVIEILKNLIFVLKAETKENYLLLGRAYYMIEDYKNAYQTYNDVYKFKKQMTKEEKSKLEEFIQTTRSNLNGQ